ncbi:LapA family protein [Mycobacterium asiaticum]|uniref:LapA family protein n=1 Tax=Mycobacterium asiaticum TaxID=1790 RepID=UPI000AF0EB0E
MTNDSTHDLAQFETKAERTPGLVVIAGAVMALVVSAATFALGHAGAGIAAASIGMLVFGGGLAWLAEERRRVRQVERDLRYRDRR